MYTHVYPLIMVNQRWAECLNYCWASAWKLEAFTSPNTVRVLICTKRSWLPCRNQVSDNRMQGLAVKESNRPSIVDSTWVYHSILSDRTSFNYIKRIAAKFPLQPSSLSEIENKWMIPRSVHNISQSDFDGWWLTYPSEKYWSSQLGWWHSQYMET